MTAENLENTFRAFKYREPFEPFVLELADGKKVLVDDPAAFGFGEGYIIYVTATNRLLELNYGEVSSVSSATTEASR